MTDLLEVCIRVLKKYDIGNACSGNRAADSNNYRIPAENMDRSTTEMY